MVRPHYCSDTNQEKRSDSSDERVLQICWNGIVGFLWITVFHGYQRRPMPMERQALWNWL
jgi:hypothetical protein